MSTLRRPQAAARDHWLIRGAISNLGARWGLTPSQSGNLAERCWALAIRKKDVVAERNARPLGVFVVAYGTVKLVLRRSNGEQRVLSLVSAQQIFGVSCALLGRPYAYDAIAHTDAKLIVIPGGALTALMDQDTRFSRRVALMLAERNLELLAELESATTLSGAQRLASYLLSLAGPDTGDACETRLLVSKTLLAARLGIKKETLSRLLSAFAADGLIRVSQRDVSLLDRKRLADPVP